MSKIIPQQVQDNAEQSRSINPNIFRAYDMRGIYPKEINPEVAYKVGRSLVEFLRKKTGKRKLNIVVGRDNRLSSMVLYRALKKGILAEGANVIDIGLGPTQVFYFAVWNYKFDGGVMVTASHNPPEYNGFKLVEKEAVLIAANTGIKKIKQLVLSEEKRYKITAKLAREGKITRRNVIEDYLKFNFSQFNLKKIKPFKIAIDTANGVGGILIPRVSKEFPGKIHHLFPKLDGSFPNHLPNPMDYRNLRDVAKFVKEKKLDLGVAFDGDGDRIFFVDEKGTAIPSSLTLSLLSQIILRQNPGEKIVYTLCMSNIIKDTVRESGGTPLSVKIGFTFLKQKMREHNAIFGGEFSGHYAHREHGFCEAPFFVLFTILKEMSDRGKTISQLLAPFKKYFFIGTINLKIKDKKRILKLLEKKYKGGKISHLDGLRIDFKEWWFNVRPSNTENLLRLVIEAKTKSLQREKLKEIMTIVRTK